MGQLNTTYNSNINVNNPIDEGLAFTTNAEGKSKVVLPMYETSLMLSGILVGFLVGITMVSVFKKSGGGGEMVYLIKE